MPTDLRIERYPTVAYVVVRDVTVSIIFILKGAYLIEEPLGKLLEALSTHKALFMVQLSIAVHDLLSWSKPTLASLADGICQSICHVAVETTQCTS